MGKTDQQSTREYHAPEWFLNHYTQTPTDLQSKIEIVPKISFAEDSHHNADKYQVEEEDYEELRYTVAGSIVSKHDSGVPMTLDHNRPGLTIKSGSLAYGTGIVEHLAKDLNATLVTVDVDIMLHLAEEFMIQETTNVSKEQNSNNASNGPENGGSEACSTDHVRVEAESGEQGGTANKQDGEGENSNPANPGEKTTQEPEPDDEETANWIKKLQRSADQISAGEFLFASRCESHSKPGRYRRSRQAIHAIIKAGLEKTTDGRPVIVHVRGCCPILNLKNGKTMIKNLRRAVQEYRQKQEPVLLVGTIFERPAWMMGCKIATSPGFDFDFNCSTLLSRYEASWKRDEQRFALNKMVLMTLAHLQRSIAPSMCSKVLPDVVQLNRRDLIADGPLPHVDLAWVSKQMLGCLMTNGALEVQDFERILKRANRPKKKGDRERDDGEKKKDTKSIATRLEELRDSCTEFERHLFSCVLDPENQKVTYNDVIVEDTVKDTMKYYLRMSQLQFEGSSQTLIDSASVKGALLYGPPGTGKTQLVRAMASDSNSAMIAITAADVEDKYVGETQKKISAAFSLARKLSPCILFIDEVDALFYRRSSCDASWTRQHLTQFLQEMDGISKNDENRPFVIGATNHPMDLDDAFIRRLPYKVLFKLPGLEERRQILNIFLKSGDLDPLVSIDAIAQQTEGLSGSDLRLVCGQAALDFAMERTRSSPDNDRPINLCLDNNHIARALQKVRPSVSKRSHENIDAFTRQYNTVGAPVVDTASYCQSDHASDALGLGPTTCM